MTSPVRVASQSRLLLAVGIAFTLAAVAGIGGGALAVTFLGQPGARVALQSPHAWPAGPPNPLDRDTAVTPLRAAPELRLTDQDGKPFDLASLRGTPVFVFFGYTHCPDVCPTTLADVRDGLARSAVPAKMVFVTVDPARDDPAALRQFLGYYQAGFIGLTGTEEQIRAAADAWGIQYARVDTGSASGYSMAHTGDTFLVDANGLLRHRIWFGAGPAVFADRLARVATGAQPTPPAATPAAATPVATAAPSPASTAAPAGTPAASPSVAPSAATVIAGLQTTVIRVGMNWLVVTTSSPLNRELAWPDVSAHVRFRNATDATAAPIDVDGFFIWVSVGARGAFVFDASFPSAGPWDATITLTRNGAVEGSAEFPLAVQERGTTPAVGEPAPSVHTPTAADAGGFLANITTDVFPDPRFYRESVDQLLAEHKPFVLVFYSPAYCPTTACGPLLKYLKVIADEFPTMSFVHVEPHVMTNYGNRLVPDWSTGNLEFNAAAKAYGIPVEPFVFVVDSQGLVSASFELIVGSDEMRAAIRATIGG